MFRSYLESEIGHVGWIKRHRTALGYIYVTLAFVLCLGLIQRNHADALHATCIRSQEGRSALRNTIIVATTRTASSSRLDLTLVPGFDGLDPALQEYLRNLTVGLNSGPPPVEIAPGTVPPPDPSNQVQVTLLAQSPPIEC